MEKRMRLAWVGWNRSVLRLALTAARRKCGAAPLPDPLPTPSSWGEGGLTIAVAGDDLTPALSSRGEGALLPSAELSLTPALSSGGEGEELEAGGSSTNARIAAVTDELVAPALR